MAGTINDNWRALNGPFSCWRARQWFSPDPKQGWRWLLPIARWPVLGLAAPWYRGILAVI